MCLLHCNKTLTTLQFLSQANFILTTLCHHGPTFTAGLCPTLPCLPRRGFWGILRTLPLLLYTQHRNHLQSAPCDTTSSLSHPFRWSAGAGSLKLDHAAGNSHH